MKWQKYAVSAGALLLLTAFCMLLPNVHALYAQVDRSHATVKPVDLTVPQPADLSAGQVLQILAEVGGNVLLLESGVAPERAEAAQTCREILADLFGGPTAENDALHKLLAGRLDAYSAVWTDAYTCVALHDAAPVQLTLITAQFEDLYICYEQNTRALVSLAVHNRGGITENVGNDNEYSDLLYQSTAVQDYYGALGLKDWAYDYYAYNHPQGVELYVGLSSTPKGMFYVETVL